MAARVDVAPIEARLAANEKRTQGLHALVERLVVVMEAWAGVPTPPPAKKPRALRIVKGGPA